jgi:alginate O-acetyltransferase complex protein AlgI
VDLSGVLVSILQILVLAGLAAFLGLLRRGRSLALVGFSALVIYWIQPPRTIFPSLSFWLPTLTIFITVLAWVITAPSETRGMRRNWPALAILVGVILLVTFGSKLTWAALPVSGSLRWVGIALVIFFGLIMGGAFFKYQSRFAPTIAIFVLLAVFVFLKFPWLSERLLVLVADLRGRSFESPLQLTVAWLGYSYISFRILHTIRDRQSGILPAVDLAEYVNYVIFFPAFSSGPIDRLERFVKELRAPMPIKNEDWLFAGQRLARGLFKKFFVADILAMVSITDLLVSQTRTPGWLWFTLSAYSLRIYFDFSGYTDIAIGMGRLIGFHLPENFAAPFLKPNLTQFWNSWHMTLTQWFRSYYFNPLARSLRTSKLALPPWLIISLAQISTMLLIGLWHGITWNYALWGLWHGMGLFIQSRWSEFIRIRFPDLGTTSISRVFFQAVGVLLTFGYFTLGMAFFALSTPQLSFTALLKLFGIS